jgi:hypothetical protein
MLVSGTYGKQGKNFYTTGLHVFCTTDTVPMCYPLDFGITVHITVHITVRGALPVYVLNIPGCEFCWPMVLVQSAGLDEGDWMSGSRRRAGAVSDRPAQLQQPGQIFLLAFSIG